MLPLLKKNSELSVAPGANSWHPDFRNTAQLPDAKVIRTTFFVNALLGIAVVSLLMVVVYQELTLSGLRDQINQLDEQIARDLKPSKDAVALFKEYQSEEGKILEFEGFRKNNSPLFSSLLHTVGKTIPAKISVSSIEYSSSGANFRGLVVGTPEQATTLVSSYEKQLQTDELIGKAFEKITLTNLARASEGSDKLVFEIVLRSSAAKAQSKKP